MPLPSLSFLFPFFLYKKNFSLVGWYKFNCGGSGPCHISLAGIQGFKAEMYLTAMYYILRENEVRFFLFSF